MQIPAGPAQAVHGRHPLGARELLPAGDSKSGRKPQQASGTFAFSRPGKFRWTYEKPYAQLLVGDGTKLWATTRSSTRSPPRSWATRWAARRRRSWPATTPWKRTSTLQKDGAADGLEWVEARPKADDSSFERIRMGFSGGQLKAMVLHDNFGQTTSLLSADRAQSVPRCRAVPLRATQGRGRGRRLADCKRRRWLTCSIRLIRRANPWPRRCGRRPLPT
jgi:hypothetical protein